MPMQSQPEPASCQDCWLRLSRNADALSDDDHHDGEWKAQLALSLLCAVATAIASILHHQGWEPASLATFALAYLAGAWEPANEVLEKIRTRQIDVHFLMLAVAAGAACIGEWAEGAILLFLFSFAGALEHFALERTRRAINSLINAAPKTALRILPDGSESETPVEQLQRGMLLRIPPGSQFPVDCTIASGDTHVDESSLTGEAIPVPKKRGDQACSGTLNIEGSITASVLRPASQSALQRIISLIRDAQRQKAPSQRFTDRFGNGYTIGILLLTLVAFLTWWLVLDIPPLQTQDGTPSAFYRAMTLLVVASPCALVLSIPSAILAAIARGARHGILFRGGVAVEHLADTNVVAMDKTGTLTTGELKVENVIAYPPENHLDILQTAVSLEHHSNHPLARAITRFGQSEGIQPSPVQHLRSITGQGIVASINGKPVRLGRAEFITEPGEELPETQDKNTFGISEVWVKTPHTTGCIRLRDEVRLAAKGVIQALRRRGLLPLVLTGDRPEAAESLREKLSITDIYAGLSPHQKLDAISRLQRQGRNVAMIGDGINDAPALAASHVGVAMGARGSDAAMEQADLILMHDRLENFVVALDISRAARSVIRQNLAISLGVVLILVVLALGTKIPLTVGVIGHEGSTLLVVLNSLRLLFCSIPALREQLVLPKP
jgi:Cd2+/Zn2+-exporting ATPase